MTATVGPDAADDVFVTPVRQNATFAVLTNDSCPGTCTVSVVAGSGPSTGTLTLNLDNTFTFSSGPNHDVGPVSFQYRISSSLAAGVTDTATATVDVLGTTDDTATTQPGQAVDINVLANDPCSDCSVGGIGTPSAGAATAGIAGHITYTPPATFSGVATFTYQAAKNGRSTSAAVTVTVLPTATDDSEATAQGVALVIDPRANDLCVACLITGVTAPDGGGTATVAGNGQSITYISGVGVGAGQGEHFDYTLTDTVGHTFP